MIKKRDADTKGPGKQKRYTKILMRKIGTLFKFPFARGIMLWKLGVKIKLSRPKAKNYGIWLELKKRKGTYQAMITTHFGLKKPYCVFSRNLCKVDFDVILKSP